MEENSPFDPVKFIKKVLKVLAILSVLHDFDNGFGLLL
jgi:hypothetical protein